MFDHQTNQVNKYQILLICLNLTVQIKTQMTGWIAKSVLTS